jgi:hypothetical protein
LRASGAIKKIDIIIKLDKKILERLSSPLSCILGLLFFLKSFTVLGNDVSFFFIIILQPLLSPQVNNDTKDFAHLALRSLSS